MRCVVVNGASLKAETRCARCGSRIAESYIREIGNRLFYCDYECFGIAVQSSVQALAERPPMLSAWTRSS
jgi:hypothetical protein